MLHFPPLYVPLYGSFLRVLVSGHCFCELRLWFCPHLFRKQREWVTLKLAKTFDKLWIMLVWWTAREDIYDCHYFPISEFPPMWSSVPHLSGGFLVNLSVTPVFLLTEQGESQHLLAESYFLVSWILFIGVGWILQNNLRLSSCCKSKPQPLFWVL